MADVAGSTSGRWSRFRASDLWRVEKAGSLPWGRPSSVLGHGGFGLGAAAPRTCRGRRSRAATSAANITAFNLGDAGGAWLGGVAIGNGLGSTAPNWSGAVLGVWRARASRSGWASV
ncbi:hypothetical protein ABZ345_12785 [Lentzea sp. NPDC005914]|uniref:hypothetical protein n=1 Tax=Lentzea sp. NPDC005914 TaxID=3154572 RepID=UPI0033FBC1A6